MARSVAPARPETSDAAIAEGQDTYSLHLKDFLSYRLSRLSRVMDRDTEVRLARRYDLSLTESRVLGHLAVVSPTTIRRLAEEMCLDKAQVSRAATALVKLGYAMRRSDPADRRSAMFSASDQGKAHYRAHLAQARKGQGELLSVLTIDEKRLLDTVIDKLMARFREVG